MANPTPEAVARAISTPMGPILDAHGITREVLARELRAELEAKSTKTVKIKGSVPTTKRGVRVLAESAGNGGEPGETVLAWDEIDWGTRQRARMDAHKLRGDYPSERVDLSSSGPLEIRVVYDEPKTGTEGE